MTHTNAPHDASLAPEVRCDLIGLRFRLPQGWQVTQQVTWESAPLPGCRVIVHAQRPGSDARIEVHGFRRGLKTASLPVERQYAARALFLNGAASTPLALGGRDAEVFHARGQAPDGSPTGGIGFFVSGPRVCYGLRGEWAKAGEDDEVALALATIRFGEPTENPPPTRLNALRLEATEPSTHEWGVRDIRLAHTALLGKQVAEGELVRLQVGERAELVAFRVTGMGTEERGLVHPATRLTLDQDVA